MKIISGGQTGVDEAGLEAAAKHRLPTAGYMPSNFRNEDGLQPSLARRFGLLECPHGGDYRARTERNVVMSDAVLIIGRPSPGSNLTRSLARRAEVPCEWIAWGDVPKGPSAKGWGGGLRPTARQALIFGIWLERHNPERLMVAGNRESGNPGIFDATLSLLDLVFAQWWARVDAAFDLDERAAICEHHGGLTRERAEQVAAECAARSERS